MGPCLVHHSKSTSTKNAAESVDIGPAESANGMFTARTSVLFWTPPHSKILDNSNAHFLCSLPLPASSTMESDLQQCDKDAGMRQFRPAYTWSSKQTVTGMSSSELSKSTKSIATNRYVTPPTTTELQGHTTCNNVIQGKCVTTMYMPLACVVSQMAGGTLAEHNKDGTHHADEPDEENMAAHQAHLAELRIETAKKMSAKKIAAVSNGTHNQLAENFVSKKVMCAKGTECVAYDAARGHIAFMTAHTRQKICYLCSPLSHCPFNITKKFGRQCKPGETPQELYVKRKTDRMAGLCVPC